MFKLLLSIVGGAILLLIGMAISITVFIYRVRPASPGGTVGFSPQQLIQVPIIFVPMLFIFATGFAATFLLLRHR